MNDEGAISQVRALCVDALAICSLQQYPTVPCVAQPNSQEHPPLQPMVSKAQELFQWTRNQDEPSIRVSMKEQSSTVVEKDRAHSQAQHEGMAGQNLEEDSCGVVAERPSMEDVDSDNSSDYDVLRQFRDTSPDS